MVSIITLDQVTLHKLVQYLKNYFKFKTSTSLTFVCKGKLNQVLQQDNKNVPFFAGLAGVAFLPLAALGLTGEASTGASSGVAASADKINKSFNKAE